MALPTAVTLVYKAFQGGGVSLTVLNTLMASIPPAPDVLAAMGCYVTSDVTVNGPPVTRTVTAALVPGTDAVAIAHVEPSDASGSRVVSVSVSSPGDHYVLPPIVFFSGGRAPEPPVGIVDNDELAPSAVAVAFLKFVGVDITTGGTLYSAGTTIEVVGGLKTGGRAAVLTPVLTLGAITGVTIVDPGDGYTSVPKLVVVDSTGSGAALVASMGVGRISVTRGGKGYVSAPTVALVAAFRVMFGSLGSGGAPFKQLLTAALAQATSGPIDAEPPVFS